MAGQTDKANSAENIDVIQCEYVPFGAEDKIKLSFNLILRWLAVKTAKGAVPHEQDLMKFLMTCKAKRLNPFDGDAFLVGYDGKDGPVFSTIVAHQAFLKRAETHPEFDGMESGVIIGTDENIKELVGDFFPHGSVLLGGWATVFFKTRKHPMTKRLKLATFDKGRSLWKTNPEGMITKCAEADALRSSFPQLIGGMYLREEMERHEKQATTLSDSTIENLRPGDIAAPFRTHAREKFFVDRGGSMVDASRTARYEQDAVAAGVTEMIRQKSHGVHEETRSVDGDMVDMVPKKEPSWEDTYSAVLGRCLSCTTASAGEEMKKEINLLLVQAFISPEQACQLKSQLYYHLESIGIEISS